MFGWEFPPRMTGGLGTACHGLVQSLIGQGIDVSFVIPSRDVDDSDGHETGTALSETRNGFPETGTVRKGLFRLTRVPPNMNPYAGGSKPIVLANGDTLFQEGYDNDLYGGDLLAAVDKLAHQARTIAAKQKFDVIHAHDWMTFRAGLAAREVSGCPLVIHLHSIEYDRCLDRVWPPVVEIEREGTAAADRIITVSARSKWMVVDKYGVDPDKITVVHNGLNREHLGTMENAKPISLPPRTRGGLVLFLGRITPQKGPNYFVEAAAKVLRAEPHTVFLMAGSGDMVPGLVERTAELGISQNVLFAGFLEGDQVLWVLDAADVYVMPSVSDPFGISCLEAMYASTPVIVSNQSGISEVVGNVMKVDYWDVDAIADNVVRLLRDPQYAAELASRGAAEARTITWDHPASRCRAVYREVLAESGHVPRQE